MPNSGRGRCNHGARPPVISRRSVVWGGLGLAATLSGWAGRRVAAAAPLAATRVIPGSAADRVMVWNVDGLDYVAEEYFLSGNSAVYRPVSMADAPDVGSRHTALDLGRREFSLDVLSASEAFTTRLIVYRPRDPRRFSGTAIVETLHPNGGGTSLAWGALHAFFAAHGDAYVGVQHPLTFAGLKAADPLRYGDLAAASPTQLWGMLTQTGAVLKTGGAGGPLAGLDVKRLVMTGYSFTGVATATYANYHHADARLDGRPIFDGYVPMADAQYVRPLDVPVMRINTQSDFNGFDGLQNRRQDDPRYRHYEIAGAAHVAEPPPTSGATPPTPGRIPTPEGQPHFSVEQCQPEFPAGSHANDFPLYLVQSALFSTMHHWLESGRPPPPSAYIQTHEDGTTRTDSWGNAMGGVRYPQVALPIARYGVGSTDRCVLFGYTVPFDAARCRSLYGDHAAYVDRLRALTRRLVAQRLLLPDGAQLLVAAAHARTTFA